MIKAAANLGDDTHLLVLGLSHANLDELEKHRPISFPLRSVDIDTDRDMVVTYVSPEGKCAVPEEKEGEDGPVVMMLRHVLATQIRGGQIIKVTIDCRHKLDLSSLKEIRLIIFSKETESEMLLVLKGLTTPNTKVTYPGIPPSDIPQNMN